MKALKTVLSLFDGISCGQIALKRVGITFDNYFASEIDKYALMVTQRHFPETFFLGDVLNWKQWDIDWSSVDLVLAGSPCQGFSPAGNQKAFNDPRSKLFFVFVEILAHVKASNPNVYFLLENVVMKKDWMNVITQKIGVEPVIINSSLVSAQNRRRVYWANWGFKQPEDKKILLPDILESGFVDRQKSYCLDASYYKGGNLKSYFKKSRRQLVFEEDYFRCLDPKDHPAVQAAIASKTAPVAFTERRTEEAKRIRKEHKKKYGKDFSPRRGKELAPRKDGKMNCLTATYSTKEHSLLDHELRYRKLTPIEAERLQTLPDEYTKVEGVSDTQRYKMIGNGWNVDTVAHILSAIPQ